MGELDYYKLLGVDVDADTSAIRKAYRRRARLYHPDKNTTAYGAKMFEDLAKAVDVLSDAEARSAYDALRRVQVEKAKREEKQTQKVKKMRESLLEREQIARAHRQKEAEARAAYKRHVERVQALRKERGDNFVDLLNQDEDEDGQLGKGTPQDHTDGTNNRVIGNEQDQKRFKAEAEEKNRRAKRASLTFTWSDKAKSKQESMQDEMEMEMDFALPFGTREVQDTRAKLGDMLKTFGRVSQWVASEGMGICVFEDPASAWRVMKQQEMLQRVHGVKVDWTSGEPDKEGVVESEGQDAKVAMFLAFEKRILDAISDKHPSSR